MSWLTKITGAPDINLNKLFKGDKKEQEKAAPVLAEAVYKAVPRQSTEMERWMALFVSKLPVLIVLTLRDACDQSLKERAVSDNG